MLAATFIRFAYIALVSGYLRAHVDEYLAENKNDEVDVVRTVQVIESAVFSQRISRGEHDRTEWMEAN